MTAELNEIRTTLTKHFNVKEIGTASVGGSGTMYLDTGGPGFPEALSCAGPETVKAVFRNAVTPFGEIPIVKLISVDGQPVIRVPYHGWRLPDPTVQNTLATFWLLHKLGVRQVVVDASVGGIRAKPWDMVIPDDIKPGESNKNAVKALAYELGIDPWIRMAQPFCPRIRKALFAECQWVKNGDMEEPHHPIGDIIDGGVAVTTPLSLFESAAEIREMANDPSVVDVNQSSGQEALAARLTKMCIAVLHPVANYAEGISDGAWMPEEGGMQTFYQQCPIPVSVITYRTIRAILGQPRNCSCTEIAGNADLEMFTHPIL
jgi:purine nucleoside phosphorylase